MGSTEAQRADALLDILIGEHEGTFLRDPVFAAQMKGLAVLVPDLVDYLASKVEPRQDVYTMMENARSDTLRIQREIAMSDAIEFGRRP